MEQRVSLVTLGVGDLERSRAFYEKLGWRAHSSSQENFVVFQLQGSVLSLFPRQSLGEDVGLSETPAVSTGAVTLAYNARSRQEVDAVLKEAQEAGAQILKDAEEVFWGGYSGYFADPDGHAWEVAHNPFWKLGEDGQLTLPSG